MTIETTLQIEFGKNSYVVIVKMIKIESASYFFVRDKENEKSLLSGKTLELTYVDSFSLTEFGGVVKSPGIPQKVVAVIQRGIMMNSHAFFTIP